MSDFFIDIFGYDFIVDSSLRMLVRMMLATIAFHYSWKKSNMHANNTFLPSAFLNHLSTFLIKLSSEKNPWNKTVKTSNFTGIPPYVTILTTLEAIRTSQDGISD